MKSSSQKFTVPQKFFCHFYLVTVVWTTLLLVITWMYAYKSVPLVYPAFPSHLTGGSHIFSWHKSHSIPISYRYRVWRSVFLLLLMVVQALRRLFETMYVFNYSSFARMHIFGYLTGLLFYTAAPLSLCCNNALEVYKFSLNAVDEFIVKGKTTMQQMEFDWLEFVSSLSKLRLVQWTGAAIFFWGWIHQRNCHAILELKSTWEFALYVSSISNELKVPVRLLLSIPIVTILQLAEKFMLEKEANPMFSK